MSAPITSPSPDADRPTVSRWKLALWTAPLLVLAAISVASKLTDGSSWGWTLSDFVFASVLVYGAFGAYEGLSRLPGSAMYRAGAALAVVGAFLLTWVNAAVGLTDSDADVLYLGVVALGVLGAIAARFRPSGMMWTMGATALAHVLVGVGALAAGIVPAHNSTMQIAGVTVFFALPFVASALLFRNAAQDAAAEAA